MKKLIALFSLIAFFAISVNAQTPEAKKTTSATEKPGCCQKSNKACCKNDKVAGKTCTADQKAECAKAGKAESNKTAPQSK